MSIVYKTRTQLVVETLREKILSGEIKAGQPLRQAALAEELNVSRIPVREALLQLEAEGLVAFEPHKGATATELNVEQVDELFELRAMLEADLLAASIPHITDESLDEATDLLSRLDKALGKENAANGLFKTAHLWFDRDRIRRRQHVNWCGDYQWRFGRHVVW